MNSTPPTVLLVSAEQTQTVNISPRLLRAVKPLLFTFAVLVLLLAAALSWLGWQHVQTRIQHAQVQQAWQQEVADLKNQTSAEIQEKTAEIQTKVAALQKSKQVVLDLQDYLSKRGVHVKPVAIPTEPGKPIDSAGGPARPVLGVFGKEVPFTGTFAEDAETLLQALELTPLGSPYKGAITSRFGSRANPFTGRGSEGHSGLDIKGRTGDPIRATAKGRVVFAGTQNGYGKVVRVRHGNGYETLFAHLSKINVKVGQRLQAGDVLGLLGSTGRSTGPHLHYEVIHKGKRLNPEKFLSLAAAWAKK